MDLKVRGQSVVSSMLIFVMLFSLLSVGVSPPVAGGTVPTSVSVGDYVQFGKYNNEPILWRVINLEENGNPILLSDRILTLKAFDAEGSYHEPNSSRAGSGSNFYRDSNIRQWLNSDSCNVCGEEIDWIQNDPTNANTNGENGYRSERGFLADGNFSPAERSWIQPLTHKVVLSSTDDAQKEGGTADHIENSDITTVVQNYDTTANYMNVTDHVFLLSVKQLKEWVFDRNALYGSDYLFAKPTPGAVANSTYQTTDLNSSNNWSYWLNTPRANRSQTVRYVTSWGGLTRTSANSPEIGVRPALQMNLAAAGVGSGSGTLEQPYIFAAPAANEPPSNISLAPSSVDEIQAPGTIVGTLSSADADASDTAIYTLTCGEGDADNSSFTIDETSLKTSASFDFETKSVYSVRVRVTDSAGNRFEKSLKVNVTDVYENLVPTDISVSRQMFSKNEPLGTAVATLSSVDGNLGDTAIYSLVSGSGSTDNALFKVEGTSLKTATSFVAISKSTFSIRVRVTDGSDATYEEVFTLTGMNGTVPFLGDYVTFGSYENQPILWRVIHVSAEGVPTLFSDRAITSKAFDSRGDYHAPDGARIGGGSNYYPDSNIRQWLNSNSPNSGDNLIDWIQNDPVAANLFNGVNPYSDEKGFLADGNFTAEQREMILPLTHNVVISPVDAARKDGGSEGHIYNSFYPHSVQNYDNAFFKTVTDHVFLLSVKQVKEYVIDNLGVLGSEYHYCFNRGGGLQHCYVNTADSDGIGVRSMSFNGDITSSRADAGVIGIRPALQINPGVAKIVSGDGSAANPYTYQPRGQAPTDLQLSEDTVTENESAGTVVGTLSATDTDSDAGQLSFMLVSGVGGEDNKHFTIDGTALKTSSRFNYEVKSSYSILVRVTDEGGEMFEKSFTIKVSDVTEIPPQIGDFIQFGKFYNEPILWRVVHIDADGNPILVSDRILTIKAFDAKGSYHLGDANRAGYGSNFYRDSNIRQWLNSNSANVGADIIDWIQNDPTETNLSAPENAYHSEKGFLADGNFTAQERNWIKPYAHKVALPVAEAALAEGGTANLSNVEGYFSSSTLGNYDTAARFKIVTDQVFLMSTKQAKEWLYDKRELLGADYYLAKPTAEAVLNSTYQNAKLDSAKYFPYWLNTPEANYTDVVYNIMADGWVTTDGASLPRIGVRPALQLTASAIQFDSGIGTDDSPYLISAAPNAAPTDLSLDASTIAENEVVGSTVGTLSGTDADAGDTLSYSLVSGEGDTDNTSFSLDGSTLKTGASFDYETKSSYSIRAQVTDAGGLTFAKSFTITVTDVAENTAPFDISLNYDSLPEDAAIGTSVGTFTADDANAGDIFTYTLVSGEGDTDNSKFSIDGNTLKTATNLDYETQTSVKIRVEVTDNGGLTFAEQFTLLVGNVNEAPTDISISAQSLVENQAVGTEVGDFTFIDPDDVNGESSLIAFSLVSGVGDTDNAKFDIQNTSLVTAAVLDYEQQQSYSIRVRVNTTGSLTYEESFTITVTDVNEAPTDISLSGTTIAENAGADAAVGTLSAMDADAGATSSFSLVSGVGDIDNASFNISGTTLRATNSFDFETKSSYSVRVQVSDGNLTYDETFTITVTDVNEAPTDITLIGTTIKENALLNAMVGNFSATDADAGDNVTFSLVSGEGDTDNASFNINDSSLLATNSFDFETKATYSLRVRASDSNGFTYEKVFTVTVTDVPEFRDVKENSWFAPAITYLAELNIINGDGKGNLRPMNDMTRAEFIKTVVTALDIKTTSTEVMNFKDVTNTNAWFYDPLQVAFRAGLVRGFPDGTVKPNDDITRQDAMIILHRALKIQGYGFAMSGPKLSDLKDADKVSSFAVGAIDDLVRTGIVNGSNGMLKPQDDLNRAEGFTLIYRVMQMLAG